MSEVHEIRAMGQDMTKMGVELDGKLKTED